MAAPLTGTVVVGGAFGQVAGANQTYLAALDAATGALAPWNPAPNSYVLTMSYSGLRSTTGLSAMAFARAAIEPPFHAASRHQFEACEA
jgi:hypothetical protein